MAAQLDLAGSKGESECDDRFWNHLLLLLKSTAEPQWLHVVNTAKRKPDYGMRDLDEIMEERTLVAHRKLNIIIFPGFFFCVMSLSRQASARTCVFEVFVLSGKLGEYVLLIFIFSHCNFTFFRKFASFLTF